MSLAEGLATTAGFVAAAMIVLFAVSLRRRDVSLVDVWWGPGFAGIAAVAWLGARAPGPRGALLCVLTALWGLRLGTYLLWRNHGAGEDPRYAAMRRRHGERFARVSAVTVFGLQGLLQWLISLPLQVAQLVPGPTSLGSVDAIGSALFALGLCFEAVGDWQLMRFKAEPAHRGRVLDRGLWRYTRHPNYFGDCLVWWGLWTVAAATPCGPWTLASPLLMTFLLLRVSGVPLLERSLVRSRPGYRDYVARTPAFFPWRPRRIGPRPAGSEPRP
jgi:steroid 5-alpha reductase family enzyme